MNQSDIEKQYSRKTIRELVKSDVDASSQVFKDCVKAVNIYTAKSYYDSKDKRIKELLMHTITTEEIVTELFASVLPYQVITPIQSIAANLGSRLGYAYIIDSIKTASEIIAVCEPSGLYTIYHSEHPENDTATLGIQAHYSLSQHVITYINNTMFLPPMVCRPKKWLNKDNTGGGYLHGSGSCILGTLNHHNLIQSHDVLNILQAIPWELNKYMLDNHDEQPNDPLETHEQLLQFEHFKHEAIEIRKILIEAGNRFFFGWKFCKRGRSYSTGYHVNLQSTEYQKSVIQFAHKETLIC